MGQHCYISTLRDVFASQLFALLRLIHKHPLRNDPIVFDQKTHKTKQKFLYFGPCPSAQLSHGALWETKQEEKKKEIRPFHASFRHSRGVFYPCSIAKHRPLESPRMGDSVILGSPQRKPETSPRLIAYYWQHAWKVRFIFSKWELICVTKILISHFRQGASELSVLHWFLNGYTR